MVSSDLPELRSLEDINYVRQALFLDKTEDEAISLFEGLIQECLKSEWSTRVNWYFHNLKHR